MEDDDAQGNTVFVVLCNFWLPFCGISGMGSRVDLRVWHRNCSVGGIISHQVSNEVLRRNFEQSGLYNIYH